MNKELCNMIEAMIDYNISCFLDAYQCTDWGISAKEFAQHLIKEFSNTITKVAEELDDEEGE